MSSILAGGPPAGAADAIAPIAPIAPNASASDLEWLVDNATAYASMLGAIDSAHVSVRMMQLALDADCVAYGTDADTHATRTISSALVEASRRGTRVDLLLNASLLLDTAKAMRAFFRNAGVPNIDVRGISHFPQLLHAKVIIVDDAVAFLMGSPFANGYWDDDQHLPADARRPVRELGGRPLHDLSIRVTGPVVSDLDSIFDELWSACETEAPRVSAAPRETASGPRVVATIPRGLLSHAPAGRSDIRDALVAGIEDAREFIYIEHQYLSARPIIDVLADVLRRRPSLEVIVLMNQNPDVTAYRTWQNQRLAAAGLLSHPRVGLFSLWSTAQSAAAATSNGGHSTIAINQIFVHSKVVIVDDRWALVGSANIDGVSLFSYGNDFESRAGQRIFADVRNVDIGLVLEDMQQIRDLLERLWAEHMCSPGIPSLAPRNALVEWRSAASRNVQALRDGTLPADRVLPYSTRPRPHQQLEDVGVTNVEALDLRFRPGWLEVYCSPNWIRNMFA